MSHHKALDFGGKAMFEYRKMIKKKNKNLL